MRNITILDIINEHPKYPKFNFTDIEEMLEKWGNLQWNEALERAADEALANSEKVYSGIGEEIEVYVDKHSILRWKK